MNEVDKKIDEQLKARNFKLLAALAVSFLIMLIMTMGLVIYLLKEGGQVRKTSSNNNCCSVEVIGHRSDSAGNTYYLTKDGWVSEKQINL